MYPSFKKYNRQMIRVIERKFDGYSAKIYWHENALRVMGKTRDFTPAVCQCDWMTQLRALGRQDLLLAELIVPGAPSTEVASALAHDPRSLVLKPHTVVHADPRKNSFLQGYSTICELGFQGPNVHHFVNPTAPSEEMLNNLMTMAREEGWEGYILKHQVTSGWYKLKVVKSLDCVVTDVGISDSDQFMGQMRNVSMGVYRNGELVYIGDVGSGFSHADRAEEDLDIYKGRVMEVQYAEVTSHRHLWHPRFIRWRTDKDAKDCLYSQLMD